MLTTVEKVIFLQEVSVFAHLSSENLAHIAAIGEEVAVAHGGLIYEEGGRSDSMFLVLEGSIRLHQNEREIMTAQKNDSFGTWALFEDEPRVVSATADEESLLLRIDKEDFIDLLADNVQITQGIMRSLVERVRGLMSRVS